MAGGPLTRQVGWVALGRAAGTLSILIVNALLARAWTQQEVGLYGTAWVLANTLVPLFLLGLPASLLYFSPRRSPGSRAALVLQTTLCLVGSGLLLAVLLYLAGPGLAVLLDPGKEAGWAALAEYLGPFLPYAFALVAGGLAEPALIVAGRLRWQAGLAVGMGIGLVGVAWAGPGLGLGPREVLWGFSVVGVARLLVAWWLMGRALRVSPAQREGRAGLGECLRYAWPIALNDAVGSLSRYVDRFVVAAYFSAQTFALYHLGAIEIPVSVLLASATTVLIPQVSHLYREEKTAAIAELWREAIRRLSLVVLPLFFFLFFLAGPLIALIFPAVYGPSAWVFRIFLLALPLRCAVYNPLLVGMGKARWALWGGVGDLAFNAGLSLLLVEVLAAAQPGYAHLGPALAAVVSTYVQVIFLVGMIAWHLRWGIGQLLPWGHLGRVAWISCLAGLAGLGAASWGEMPLVELALGSAVFAGVMAVAAWLSPRDRQVFRSLLKP